MIVGVCHYCGCTQDAPCIIPENMRETVGSATCAWIYDDVCNSPACVEKLYIDQAAAVTSAIMALALEDLAA